MTLAKTKMVIDRSQLNDQVRKMQHKVKGTPRMLEKVNTIIEVNIHILDHYICAKILKLCITQNYMVPQTPVKGKSRQPCFSMCQCIL